MSLLSNLMGVAPNIQNGMNMLQKFQQFAANPVAGLLSMNPRLQIPVSMMNDPEAAVKHLISTGQMTQEQYNQLSQTAQQLQKMFLEK